MSKHIDDYNWALGFTGWQVIPSTGGRVWKNELTDEMCNKQPPKDWNLAGAVLEKIHEQQGWTIQTLDWVKGDNGFYCEIATYIAKRWIPVGREGKSWPDAIISAARKTVKNE